MDIIPFKYDRHEVRTVTIDGEPWFVAKDVCDVLDLGNNRMAVDRLDDDEKDVTSIDTLGGNQTLNIVNESGLYSLVLGSRKPEAKTFKRWITHEVIPQIRKTGQYQQKPMSLSELLYQQAKLNLEMEQRMTSLETKTENTEQTVKTALKALVTPTQLDWQQTTGTRVKRIAAENNLSFVGLFSRLYDELENSCRVNLSNRVTRAKNRLRASHASEREVQAVNKLNVVSGDPKLKTAFDGILRRAEARYAQKKIG